MKGASLRLTEAWTLVLDRLVAKQMSEATIKGYRNALDVFDAFLLGRGIRDFRDINEETAGAYVTHILTATHGKSNTPYSYISVRKKIGYVQKSFALLVKEEKVFLDPFRHLESIKKPDSLPRYVLSKSEIKQLFALPDLDTYMGFQDRTILELLYGTGIRLGELIRLDVADIDFGERLIFIRQGKGKKDRIVPCTEVALAFLREYLDAVRPALSYLDSRERALFLTLRGVRVSGRSLRYLFRKYVKKAGITRRVSPHSLRHAFATHMLEGGANVRYIQEILGHEQLSTTAVYTRVTISSLKKMVAQFHPLENGLLETEEVRKPDQYPRFRDSRRR